MLYDLSSGERRNEREKKGEKKKQRVHMPIGQSTLDISSENQKKKKKIWIEEIEENIVIKWIVITRTVAIHKLLSIKDKSIT